MDFQKPKQEELANLLAEKHRNFIKDYRKEYDILDRIAVLKEKKEQLSYWIDDSKGNPPLHQKYLQAKENTDAEVNKLGEELKNLYSSKTKKFGPTETDSKGRHKWLKTQITSHEEGETYWKNKITEIGQAGTQKEKAAEAAKAAAAISAQRKAKLLKKPAKKPVKSARSRKKKAEKTEKPAETPAAKTE